MNPHIVIVAVPSRAAPNLHSTLASLLLADSRTVDCPITLCIDGIEQYDITQLYGHLGVGLLWLTPEQSELQSKRHARQRENFVYLQGLKYACAHKDGVLVLEDDVTFSREWLGILSDAASSGEIVTGYCRFPILTEYHPQDHFYGTCAVWYPPAVARHLANALEPHIDHYFGIDNLIGHCIDRTQVRMCSFVQHLGGTSLIAPEQGLRSSPVWKP